MHFLVLEGDLLTEYGWVLSEADAEAGSGSRSGPDWAKQAEERRARLMSKIHVALPLRLPGHHSRSTSANQNVSVNLLPENPVG